jgi:hypothetical protein
MKQIIVLMLAVMFAGGVWGQDVKEVAVLSPKAIQGNVSANDKLIITSSMKKAFTTIDGYKAYTRTSQALIDAEMEFQRSGRVSDTQIKKVGEQKGVSYICTFTLSLEGNELVVNSDIIDVELGEITNSDFITLFDRTNREDVMKQCQALAYSLLGVSGGNYSASRPSSKPASTGSKTNGTVWNPDGIEMVYVEGTGSGIVATKSFYIGKYEVTQAQWKAVMGNNPSNFKGDNLPVESVSWNDVQEFIKKLNAMTGREYRLPTEAEWEYAAREGKNNSSYEYSGSNSIGNVAWYVDNSGSTPHIVGTKQANALGIYDMSGNVWEWCQDCYDSSCSPRVLRGGSWYDLASYCRVADRFYNSPGDRYNRIGFRLACSSK